MAKRTNARGPRVPEPRAITEIRVAGFKSIREDQAIEVRPLTILAGANSSGKSSMMQPVLLLKQTLEVSYDPGPLLLYGPNIKFTSADQLLSRIGKVDSSDAFSVGLRLNSGKGFRLDADGFRTVFRKESRSGFRIDQMEISGPSRSVSLRLGMKSTDILKTGLTRGKEYSETTPEGYGEGHWEIQRTRCFLEPAWVAKGPEGNFSVSEHLMSVWEGIIPAIIHLPGLRGNPERAYPATAVGPTYPGTFEQYTASVIEQWMTDDASPLAELNAELMLLKLTGGVIADRGNGVQIELRVGRLPDAAPSGPENEVNIADVGMGISQTLPVLVALHAAKPGQLVYVEQPETHLHPRAQFALAQVLAAAAKRGVRVVVETHSSMLLLGVQTLVAQGSLDPGKVKLHWFERDRSGRTAVRSGELDEAGRSGEWPEDFDDVTLLAQKEYLDAASKRMFAQ